MTGLGAVVFAERLPPACAVVVAGWCAAVERPWYVWSAFLVAAFFLGRDVKYRDGVAVRKDNGERT